MRRFSVTLLGMMAAFGAPSAAAGTREVALTYVREPGLERCPDERWIRQAVSARLGFDPFREDADVRIEAQVRSAPRGLTGTLAVTHRDGLRLGRRELSSEAGDCMELASAMELAIAIAVDPQYLSRPRRDPEPPAVQAPIPPPVPQQQQVASPPPAPARPDFYTGVGLLGTAGISPYPAAGLTLRGSLRWSTVSLGLDARADFQSTAAFGGGRVSSSVLLGSIVPCVHLGRFAACAVASAGALQVTGDVAPPERRVSSPLLLLGARVQIEIPVTERLGLRPYGEAQAVLTRTSVLSGEVPVWVTAPAAGALGIAADFHFL